MSTAAEALVKTIAFFKNAQKGARVQEIRALIGSNPEVDKHYLVLEDYLTGEKFENALSPNKFMRDELAFHHLPDPLVQALTASVDHFGKQGKNSTGLFQDGGGGLFSRALFVDQMERIAWYLKNGVTLSDKGYDQDPAIIDAGKHLDSFMRAFVNFVQELSIAYLRKFDIAMKSPMSIPTPSGQQS